jgi:putative tricarboxylic transport membrane protein
MPRSDARQAAVGAGVLVVGLAMAGGATTIAGDAGYAGVGPNFLAWVVAGFLVVCGALLLREALTGGYRQADAPEGAERGHWWGFAWVSAALLANAALITTIGFIFSCALCFMLAVRGLQQAQGLPSGGVRPWLVSAAIGLAIAAPVYWMFTQLLSINLPGLTSTGWL